MKDFKPFVSASEKVKEFSFGPILMGVILGILFGASSLYLALKVGMTVSASIPVAVLSITLFKGFSKMFGIRKATILENNMVQTTGSAGESKMLFLLIWTSQFTPFSIRSELLITILAS